MNFLLHSMWFPTRPVPVNEGDPLMRRTLGDRGSWEEVGAGLSLHHTDSEAGT